jgi:hypothetical protein
MTVGEFKKWIEINNVSDDMQILLVDTTTDDILAMNYSLNVSTDLDIDDLYLNDEYEEYIGKGLIICFNNKLNENPI